MHQSTTPSLSQTTWPRWTSRQFLTLPIVQTLLPVTFVYSLSSEAVVMRQLRRWQRLWRRSLTRSHKRTSRGPSRSCWKGTTSALLQGRLPWRRLEFQVGTINKSAHTKKSGNLFNDPRNNCFTKSVIKGSHSMLVFRKKYSCKIQEKSGGTRGVVLVGPVCVCVYFSFFV